MGRKTIKAESPNIKYRRTQRTLLLLVLRSLFVLPLFRLTFQALVESFDFSVDDQKLLVFSADFLNLQKTDWYFSQKIFLHYYTLRLSLRVRRNELMFGLSLLSRVPFFGIENSKIYRKIMITVIWEGCQIFNGDYFSFAQRRNQRIPTE